MKRQLRYIRYRICRAIYYFDQCPIPCRKNFKNLFIEGLRCLFFGIVATAFFVLLILCA